MRKATVNKKHAKKRLAQRYHIEMTDRVHNHLVRLIQSGRYALGKQSHSRSKHLIPFNGQSVLIIYDKIRHTVLTALPK
jgi:hypothetical protein